MSMKKQVKQVTQSAKLGLCCSKSEQFLKQEPFFSSKKTLKEQQGHCGAGNLDKMSTFHLGSEM